MFAVQVSARFISTSPGCPFGAGLRAVRDSPTNMRRRGRSRRRQSTSISFGPSSAALFLKKKERASVRLRKRQPIPRLDDGGGKDPADVIFTKLPSERPIVETRLFRVQPHNWRLTHRCLAAFASFQRASISDGVIALRSRPRDAASRETSSKRTTNLSQAARRVVSASW